MSLSPLFHRASAHHLVSVFHRVSYTRIHKWSISADWQLDNVYILPKRICDTLSQSEKHFGQWHHQISFLDHRKAVPSCWCHDPPSFAQAKCHWWILHSAGAHQRKGNALAQGDKHWGVNAGCKFPAWQAQPHIPQRSLWFCERQLPPRPSHRRRLVWPPTFTEAAFW